LGHFIHHINGLLSAEEAETFIVWAESIPLQAESPCPIIRTVEGGLWQSVGSMKVSNVLKNYAGELKIDVFDGPAKLQVLHYRSGDRVPWHPDFRPNEVNYKVSASVCLRPGHHVFEYIASSGIVSFIGRPGDAILFPSWVAHRVTPLDKSTDERWSLAAWLRGPEYK
jgi:hypothetical protein